MNWPDRNLPPDIQARMNQKIEEFRLAASDLHGAEGAREVKKLSVELYKIWSDSDATLTEAELLSKGSNWNTDEPELAQIQKYLNRLLSGRLQEAADYFEKSENYKASLIAQGVVESRSRAATDNANKRHASNNSTKSRALKYYVEHKKNYRNKVEAAYDLAERFPPLKYETYYKALKHL